MGRVLVKALTNLGHHVIFTARTEEKAAELIKTLENSSLAHAMVIDLEHPELVNQALKYLSRLKLLPEVLINNARCLDYIKLSENGQPSRTQWLGEYQMDVVIPYELSMALATQASSPLKRVINISSMYGVVPFNPNLYENPAEQAPIHYSIAKAAQIHLTKELAIRLAPQGIQVNSISYGGIEGRVDVDFQKRYAALCPAGQMLQEEDVVGAVKFLISSDAKGMVGHNLVVDGGWSVW